MKIQTFEDNETYLIYPPQEWLDMSFKYPNGVIIKRNKFKKIQKEDCFMKMKFNKRGIDIELSAGMEQIFSHKGLTLFLKEVFKVKTKREGSNPRIIKRNEEIRREFYQLHNVKEFTVKKTHKILSEKYNLTIETIKSYVK